MQLTSCSGTRAANRSCSVPSSMPTPSTVQWVRGLGLASMTSVTSTVRPRVSPWMVCSGKYSGGTTILKSKLVDFEENFIRRRKLTRNGQLQAGLRGSLGVRKVSGLADESLAVVVTVDDSAQR